MDIERSPPKEQHGFWPVVGLALVLVSAIITTYVLIIVAFG